MNSAVKWALGLASLGVAVYVVGYAWRASQNRQANDEANFSNAMGAAGGPKCRCKGTIMPCKFCGHGVGVPINK